jgi:hypothetical protein
MSTLATGEKIRRGFDIPWPMIKRATAILKTAEEEGVSFYEDVIGSICGNCVAEYLEVHWPSHEPRPTTWGLWVALTNIALFIVNVKIKGDDEGVASSSGD